jgi:hypothetical protein
MIALNAIMSQIEAWSISPEFQQGQLPIVQIGRSRPVKINDRPGEAFYAPVLPQIGWVLLEQAQLGQRITPILPPPAVRSHLLSTPPLSVQPVIQARPEATELPWETTPMPKPLPSMASAQAASPGNASIPPATDPFDIFRRRS